MAIARVRLPNGKIARFEVNEGISPQEIELFAKKQFEAGAFDNQPKEQSFVSKVGEAALEIGPGLGELVTGAVQRGAELVGREDISGKIGAQVAKERAALTTPQLLGRSTGKIIGGAIGAAPLSGFVPGVVGSSAAISALEPTEEGTLGAAARQTAVGTLTGTLTGGAIKALGAGGKGLKNIVTRQSEEPIESAVTLKARSSRLFQEADKKGGVLNEQFSDQFIKKANDLLISKSEIGEVLDEGTLPLQVLKKIKDLSGKKFDLAGIQRLDSYLSDKINSTANLWGNISEDGKRLLDVQTQLRHVLDNVSPKDVKGGKEGFRALKEAKALWAKSLRLADVEQIIQKANMSDNPATSLKTGFRTLANNPKKLRGFSNKEKQLIKEAAKTGVVSDLFRTAGSRLVPLGFGVSGAGLMSTTGASLSSMASRDAATRLQAGKASKIVDEIMKSALPNASKSEKDIGAKVLNKLIKLGAISATQINNKE